MSNWQSIDLAPRDGRTIRAVHKLRVASSLCSSDGTRAGQHGSMQMVGRNTRLTIHWSGCPHRQAWSATFQLSGLDTGATSLIHDAEARAQAEAAMQHVTPPMGWSVEFNGVMAFPPVQAALLAGIAEPSGRTWPARTPLGPAPYSQGSREASRCCSGASSSQ
jgi:hypothetical protein